MQLPISLLLYYYLFQLSNTLYSILTFTMWVVNSLVARLLLLMFNIYKDVVHSSHAVTAEYIKALFMVYSFTVTYHIAALQLFA